VTFRLLGDCLLCAVFVERSSTKECYCQPPPPNLETIVSKLACFIKQTNIFIRRKTIRATTKRSLSCARSTGYHKARSSTILHFKNNFQASLYHRANACSITDASRIYGLILRGSSYALILTKNGIGHILGNFFWSPRDRFFKYFRRKIQRKNWRF
jgi:hypothetical protein